MLDERATTAPPLVRKGFVMRARICGPRRRGVTVVALLGLILLTGCAATSGQGGRGEVVPLRETVAIPTGNPASFAAILDHGAEAEPVTLHATLLRHPTATGPMPAVILPQTEAERGDSDPFVRALIDAGVAVLRVDSFDARGLPAADRGPPSPATLAYDALAALRVLAADPRIDRQRIGILGFGRGGAVVLAVAMDDVQRAAVGNDLHFATYLAVYPDCGITWDHPHPAARPVTMVLAGDDDLTPAETCMNYAQSLSDAGGVVLAIVYRGAAHGFDRAEPVTVAVGRPNFARCAWGVGDDGAIYDRASGTRQGGRYSDFLTQVLPGCLSAGGHVGTDGSRHSDAVREAVWFLYQGLQVTPPAT